MGRIRCLHALGEWDDLAAQVEQTWSIENDELRGEIASMAAAAAWSLRQWGSMAKYLQAMNVESPDRAFYSAILAVHHNKFPEALENIARARDGLDQELTSVAGDGYSRAYKCVISFLLDIN